MARFPQVAVADTLAWFQMGVLLLFVIMFIVCDRMD